MRPLLCLAILLTLAACQPDGYDRKGLQALADAFEQANDHEDVEQMLALYHLDGVESETVQMLRFALKTEMGHPIQTIAFKHLQGSPEERVEFAFKDRNYGPTLKPSLRMFVAYDTEEAFTSFYTIGQLPDGSWRIISAKPID